jgi:SWI/SNF-related matrix-associated actin-dependent regulator of chromatin subfamily A3
MAGPSTQNSRNPTGQTTAKQKAQLKKQQEALRIQQESLAKAAELRTMLNNLEKVDDEGRRTSLLDSLCGAGDVLGLPLHPDPPGKANGLLLVDLLKHQVCYLANDLFFFPFGTF